MSEWEVGRHLHNQRLHNTRFGSPYPSPSWR
jgi:hypothetical protein